MAKGSGGGGRGVEGLRGYARSRGYSVRALSSPTRKGYLFNVTGKGSSMWGRNITEARYLISKASRYDREGMRRLEKERARIRAARAART